MLLALLPSPAAAAERWRFRTFTTADGLAHNIVRDVLEARDGGVWFATMGGVTRYDPRRCYYQTYAPGGSLPRQEAMALAEGQDGTIWVATQGGGVAAFSGGAWTWYSTKDGLPSDEITSLMVDRSGRVWATPTKGGLAMFDGERWRRFGRDDGLSSGEIGRCAALRDGDVLCGTYEHPVLQRYDGTRWTQLVVDAPASRHFYVHALLETRDRQLWLATKGAGAVRGVPDGRGGYTWTVHDRTRGLGSDRVGAIEQTRDGAVWVGTSAGASRHDGTGWTSYSRRDGLGANQVFAITQTRAGGIWFATLGGGASYYSPSRWVETTEREGLVSDGLSGGILMARDGALWIGTDRGISIGRDGEWSTVQTGEVPLDSINHMLQVEDGTIWVATRGGLRRFRGQAWTDFGADPSGQRGPRHPVVNRIALDGRGRVWLATNGGVSSFDGVRWRSYAEREGLPSLRIYDIIVDRGGAIWAATDNGVARLERGRFRSYLSPQPASRTNRIYSLVLDAGGAIWASGLEGVYRFREGRWRPLDPNPWLPAGIYSRFAVATRDGSLWFMVRGLGVRRLLGGRWTEYTTTEGLANDTVRDVALDRRGRLLLATLGGGLSRYTPDSRAPQTHVGADAAGRGAPSSVIRGEDLVLSFGGQDVLKDTPTRDLLFSYRVDGKPWSAFSSSTRAWLVGLEAGEHRFEVRAMDRDLNIDPSPARHEFRVVRPWYAEPWVLGILGAAVLLIGYAVVRIARAVAQERQAVRREQATLDQRRQFVRLASHELRKPLTRMAHRAEVLSLPETLTDAERLAEYAAAIVDDSKHLSGLVETLLEQARVQQGLQLDPRPADVVALVRRLAAEAEAEDHPQLELPDEPLTVPCDPFYLPLALRNLLDNASKYGGGLAQVTLSVQRRGERVAVLVADRGPGIAPEDRERVFQPFFRGKTRPEHGGFGLGLSFARDIARAHGGELELEPAGEEPGARFCLSLPLQQRAGREGGDPGEPKSNNQEDSRGAATDHR